MAVKLSDQVRHPETGAISTISALADQGLIEFRKIERFQVSSRGKIRTAYFADLRGTNTGWEIGKLAYLSRTGQAIDIK